MSPHASHPNAAPKHTPAPLAAQASLSDTMRHLWPYIWPSDRPDLRLRIYLALVLLFVAKLVTIAVPYSFKWATDAGRSR